MGGLCVSHIGESPLHRPTATCRRSFVVIVHRGHSLEVHPVFLTIIRSPTKWGNCCFSPTHSQALSAIFMNPVSTALSTLAHLRTQAPHRIGNRGMDTQG